MSPYVLHDYPKWVEVLIRLARTLMYACPVIAGIGAAFFTQSPLLQGFMLSVGLTALTFGSICLIGTVTQRFIVEWISLFFLTGAITIYVLSVWFAVASQPSRIGQAGVVSMLVFALLIRLLELTIFWRMNVKAAKLQQVFSDDA